jgi:hypothetical protein
MSSRAARSPRAAQSRRGLATLELALSFPIIFFMGALIFVMAKGMVLSSEVSVEGRKNAMEQSLMHRSSGGMTQFVLTDTKFNSDIVNGGAQRTTNVIPVLGSSTLKGSSRLSVLRNTWDHTEFPLNDGNRLKFYGKILAGGSAGKFTSLISQLSDAVGNLGSAFDALKSLSSAVGGRPDLEYTPFDKLNEAKEAATAGLKDLQTKVNDLMDEISELDTKLSDLKGADLDKAKKELSELREKLRKEQGQLDFFNSNKP